MSYCRHCSKAMISCPDDVLHVSLMDLLSNKINSFDTSHIVFLFIRWRGGKKSAHARYSWAVLKHGNKNISTIISFAAP